MSALDIRAGGDPFIAFGAMFRGARVSSPDEFGVHAAQPSFADEKLAKDYLERLLDPWFYLEAEVVLAHPVGNRLRVDYLAKAKEDVGPPDFPIFGVEVKRKNEAGGFHRTIKQSVDYTGCAIDDGRDTLDRVRGQRLQRVYCFPAPGIEPRQPYSMGWHAGVDRLAGLFHVGLIYVHRGGPQFRMSDERQWDPIAGARRVAIHTSLRLGSGVRRRGGESR